MSSTNQTMNIVGIHCGSTEAKLFEYDGKHYNLEILKNTDITSLEELRTNIMKSAEVLM